MSFKVYGYERNPRTRIVRIVAELEDIPVELVKVVPRKNIGKAAYTAKFPLSLGKIPAIEGPGVQLTETIAIVTYLAKLSNKTGLFGDGSKEQEAQVLSFMNWANQEILPILALWFLPLLPGFTNPSPYNFDAVEAGKAKSLRLLTVLNSFLGEKRWLVGNKCTLADIMVAIFVSRGLEWVLDAEWRKGHTDIMQHFEAVAQLEAVKKIIPSFILIQEETPNKNPYE